MQPPEHAENLIGMLHVETNSVVSHAKSPIVASLARRYLNLRLSNAGAIFDCVTDEIRKDLNQVAAGRRDRRQWIDGDFRTAFLNGGIEILQSPLDQVIAIDESSSLLLVARRRVVEEPFDH